MELLLFGTFFLKSIEVFVVGLHYSVPYVYAACKVSDVVAVVKVVITGP